MRTPFHALRGHRTTARCAALSWTVTSSANPPIQYCLRPFSSTRWSFGQTAKMIMYIAGQSNFPSYSPRWSLSNFVHSCSHRATATEDSMHVLCMIRKLPHLPHFVLTLDLKTRRTWSTKLSRVLVETRLKLRYVYNSCICRIWRNVVHLIPTEHTRLPVSVSDEMQYILQINLTAWYGGVGTLRQIALLRSSDRWFTHAFDNQQDTSTKLFLKEPADR